MSRVCNFGALIVGALLSLASCRRDDAEARLHADVSRAPRPGSADDAAVQSRPAQQTAQETASRPPEEKDAIDLVRNFDRASVYPASVRLVLPNQHHWLDPDRYESDWETVPLPSLMISEDDRLYALDLQRQGKPLADTRQLVLQRKGFERVPRYRVSVADNNLSPGETLNFALEVADEVGTPLAHHIRNAVVHADAAGGEKPFGTVRVLNRQADTSGSRIEWQAPSADRRYWGDLQLDFELTLGGDRVAKIAHFFYSTPHEVAKFTSKFEEHLSNGSLLIRAGVDVKERVQCMFSVLLYDDARDQPLARATHVDVLDPGPHAVPFEFYGKVLHDAKFANGTLSLRQLRGECTPPHVLSTIDWSADTGPGALPAPVRRTAPERAYLPTLAMAYRTKRAFHLTEFTAKPWDSASKQRYREILSHIQESRERTELSELRLPPRL